MAWSIYPVPPSPYRYLPWIYAGYLAIGMGFYMARKSKQKQAMPNS
jgi:hypothetical protein